MACSTGLRSHGDATAALNPGAALGQRDEPAQPAGRSSKERQPPVRRSRLWRHQRRQETVAGEWVEESCRLQTAASHASWRYGCPWWMLGRPSQPVRWSRGPAHRETPLKRSALEPHDRFSRWCQVRPSYSPRHHQVASHVLTQACCCGLDRSSGGRRRTAMCGRTLGPTRTRGTSRPASARSSTT